MHAIDYQRNTLRVSRLQRFEVVSVELRGAEGCFPVLLVFDQNRKNLGRHFIQVRVNAIRRDCLEFCFGMCAGCHEDAF